MANATLEAPTAPPSPEAPRPASTPDLAELQKRAQEQRAALDAQAARAHGDEAGLREIVEEDEPNGNVKTPEGVLPDAAPAVQTAAPKLEASGAAPLQPTTQESAIPSNVDQARAEAQQDLEDFKSRLEDIKGMSEEDFEDELAMKADEIETNKVALNNPRLTPGERKQMMDDNRRLNTEMRAMKRARRSQEQAKVKAQEEDVTQADLEQQFFEQAQEAAQLEGMSVDDLKARLGESDRTVKYLRKLIASPGQKNKEALQRALNKAAAEHTLVDDAYKAKSREHEVEEGKRVEKDEAGAARMEQEELEELKRQNAKPDELDDMVEASEAKIEKLKLDIAEYDKTIDSETDPDKVDDAKKKKVDAVRESLDVRKRLRKEETAREAAKQRVEAAKGSKDKIGKDSIPGISPAEYMKLDDNEKAEHLKKLANVVELPDDEKWDAIQTAVEGGSDVSAEDMAIFTKRVSESIIDHGKKGYDMKTLYRIGVQRPELVQAIFDRVAASEEIKKQLTEKYPGWEKSKFSLKILLLLLLAALPVVGAVMAARKQFS